MKLGDILNLLKSISVDVGTITYLVGGVPRDKILHSLENGAFDLDLTTGDEKVQFVAKEFIYRLGQNYNISSKQAKDGHISVYCDNLKIDFSTNFIVPHIKQELLSRGIKNPNNLQKEMWSRDFTCNSLLLDLDLKKTIDITGKGIPDIKAKLIRTCLDPKETFSYNVNRIPRLIYLTCKLNFKIEPSIINFIINDNGKLISQCRPEYITKLLNKSISYNKDKAIQLINLLKLWDYIPISENLIVAYKNRKL